ncbi:MAG: hypothetical protein EOM16_02760 [Bacteroidia bacterium]|jgi:hypothetical protein|nr:DUF5683 domain-containing protein [Bacteroidales bacterium]MDD3299324.1 DUF5683 domain-containing protein [Bacteroidales bacterium]MDD3843796.1 DUF5683 domain-containing protein [Bacteroidales bacterium]MDD4617556.1 DUF5683 domain-containing protein [Bacteroidales bacterium]NCC45942.1 hypothetical protein [Bacteroidia bacterium]
MKIFKTVVLGTIFLLWSQVSFSQIQGQMRQIGPPGSQNTQQQQEEDSLYQGSTREPYSLKRYFNSLAGKDSMNISRMWGGSFLLPGSAQLYNKQYWKIPVVYASIGGFMYAGYNNNLKWLDTGQDKYRQNRDLFYIGAALSYWGSVMDGVANFKYHKKVLPARASLYSAMLPGLGQVYNGDYWKIPIFYGGFIVTGYFISSNNTQFKRYKNLYYLSSDPENSDYQNINPETMKYYMDSYRRLRDYSILAGVLVYALNIIDANVFAHLQDFDVSDDLSASFAPGVVMPLNPNFAYNMNPAVGFRLNIKF